MWLVFDLHKDTIMLANIFTTHIGRVSCGAIPFKPEIVAKATAPLSLHQHPQYCLVFNNIFL